MKLQFTPSLSFLCLLSMYHSVLATSSSSMDEKSNKENNELRSNLRSRIDIPIPNLAVSDHEEDIIITSDEASDTIGMSISNTSNKKGAFLPITETAHEQKPDWGAPSGLSFSRTITQLPSNAYVYDALEGANCKSHDRYGSNDCVYKWGETLSGVINYKQGITIDETHEIQGVFKLKKVVDWSFSCKACGDEPCVLDIPVIDQQVTFTPPPCPLAPEKGANALLSKSFSVTLPENSPTEGIKVPMVGTLYLKSLNDGATLGEVSVAITVK